MPSMANTNIQFLLILFAIIIGFIARKAGFLKDQDSDALSRLVFNITLPCLAFSKLSSVNPDAKMAYLMSLSFFFGVLMQILALPLMKNKSSDIKGLIALNVSGFSVGLFAYPIVQALWGDIGIIYIGMFDLGNVFITFGLNYFMGGLYSSEGKASVRAAAQKLLKSPPFVSYVIAIALSLLRVRLPSFIIDLASFLSNANMPASLLLLGITLSFKFSGQQIMQMLKILALRYGAGLAIGAAIYLLLPLDPMLKNVSLLGLILPIGVSSIVLTVQFGFDRKFSSAVNNASILVSFILIWAIFGFILPAVAA